MVFDHSSSWSTMIVYGWLWSMPSRHNDPGTWPITLAANQAHFVMIGWEVVVTALITWQLVDAWFISSKEKVAAGVSAAAAWYLIYQGLVFVGGELLLRNGIWHSPTCPGWVNPRTWHHLIFVLMQDYCWDTSILWFPPLNYNRVAPNLICLKSIELKQSNLQTSSILCFHHWIKMRLPQTSSS